MSKNQYVPLRHSTVDRGLQAAASAEIQLFDTMRRFICRTTHVEHPLSDFYRRNLLVCSHSQASLADLVGVSRRTVVETLRRIRLLGWVRHAAADSGDVAFLHGRFLVYQLGYVTTPSRAPNRRIERLFFDDWCKVAYREQDRAIAMLEQNRRADFRWWRRDQRSGFLRNYIKQQLDEASKTEMQAHG